MNLTNMLREDPEQHIMYGYTYIKFEKTAKLNCVIRSEDVARGMAQAVEYLPNKCKALNPNSSTTGKKKMKIWPPFGGTNSSRE
jgi:hypothetical protein